VVSCRNSVKTRAGFPCARARRRPRPVAVRSGAAICCCAAPRDVIDVLLLLAQPINSSRQKPLSPRRMMRTWLHRAEFVPDPLDLGQVRPRSRSASLSRTTAGARRRRCTAAGSSILVVAVKKRPSCLPFSSTSWCPGRARSPSRLSKDSRNTATVARPGCPSSR